MPIVSLVVFRAAPQLTERREEATHFSTNRSSKKDSTARRFFSAIFPTFGNA